MLTGPQQTGVKRTTVKFDQFGPLFPEPFSDDRVERIAADFKQSAEYTERHCRFDEGTSGGLVRQLKYRYGENGPSCGNEMIESVATLYVCKHVRFDEDEGMGRKVQCITEKGMNAQRKEHSAIAKRRNNRFLCNGNKRPGVSPAYIRRKALDHHCLEPLPCGCFHQYVSGTHDAITGLTGN